MRNTRRNRKRNTLRSCSKIHEHALAQLQPLILVRQTKLRLDTGRAQQGLI